MKKLILMLIILLLATSSFAQTPIKNKANKNNINKEKVVEIFTLEKIRWKNSNRPIIIYILDNKYVMKEFSRKLLNMSYSRYLDLIEKKVYSGQADKPQFVKNSIIVMEKVSNKVNAVGILEEYILISNCGNIVEIKF